MKKTSLPFCRPASCINKFDDPFIPIQDIAEIAS
jgi:hypothetical protein